MKFTDGLDNKAALQFKGLKINSCKINEFRLREYLKNVVLYLNIVKQLQDENNNYFSFRHFISIFC
jgi:hypothetical protein